MRSFVFFNGLFYKALFYGLLLSVVAKTIVNIAIEPLGQKGPFPDGKFEITHFEHLGTFPDYSDGIVGKVSSGVGGVIERFVTYDSVEMIVFISIYAYMLLSVSLTTFGENRSGLVPKYIGLGLIIAAAISNLGELAIFGHATDFLFIRVTVFSDRGFVIANFADVMLLIGIILIFITPTYQKIVAAVEIGKSESETTMKP